MIYKFIKQNTHGFSDSHRIFPRCFEMDTKPFRRFGSATFVEADPNDNASGRNRAVSETSHENIMPFEMFLVREVLEVSEINTKMSIVNACECPWRSKSHFVFLCL